VGGRSRGCFATPADSPAHDCSAYSHAHVRRERLRFVHRSRTLLLSPLANLRVTIRNFCIAIGSTGLLYAQAERLTTVVLVLTMALFAGVLTIGGASMHAGNVRALLKPLLNEGPIETPIE
jgi:hypothetical protein